MKKGMEKWDKARGNVYKCIEVFYNKKTKSGLKKFSSPPFCIPLQRNNYILIKP